MLDKNSVSIIVKKLVDKYGENEKIRIKFPDNPNKWLASETELFAAINELQAISTQSELYHLLISKNAHETLLLLIIHQNSDISSKVISFLEEISEVDDITERERAIPFIRELLKAGLIETILSNLKRLDINLTDESAAIVSTLSLLDNLIDLEVDIKDEELEKLIDWMLQTINLNSNFTTAKLSIVELLSVLMIGHRELIEYFGDKNGIDSLLIQVSSYRQKIAESSEEKEYLKQIFSCLCTLLLDCDKNKEKFLEDEGPKFIELVLRDKSKYVALNNLKLGCLEVFSHSLTTTSNINQTVSKCCETFIQCKGLQVLFPFFMNPASALHKKLKNDTEMYLEDVEEHILSIILYLLKYTQDANCLQRLLIKFSENGFQKTIRLLGYHDKYFAAADPDDKISAKTFTLQTIDYIILLVCYLSNHYEIYSPDSGEIFSVKIKKLMQADTGKEILLQMELYMEELDSNEEKNSLELLVGYFKKLIS